MVQILFLKIEIFKEVCNGAHHYAMREIAIVYGLIVQITSPFSLISFKKQLFLSRNYCSLFFFLSV